MGIYLGNTKISPTQDEITAETTARQQGDNNLNGLIENEASERRMADDELAYQLAGKFDGASQEGNKLVLTKNGTEAFRYEPTVPGAMQFKGTCLQTDLPTFGQSIGDYYALSDTEGPYVGKAAIWAGVQWNYSGSNISIEQTVQEGSTTAVSGGAVFDYTKTLLQTIYDAIYPVRSRHIGFGAPAIPAGVEATWEIDSDLNGRYLYVDSTKAAATKIDASGSTEGSSISVDQMPGHDHTIEHWHKRGDMNITGRFAMAPSGGTVDSLPIKEINGAFYNYGNAGSVTKRITDINSRYDRANGGNVVGFSAANSWSGMTSKPLNYSGEDRKYSGSTGSGKAHSHGIGTIKPAAVTVQVWKRTA